MAATVHINIALPGRAAEWPVALATPIVAENLLTLIDQCSG